MMSAITRAAFFPYPFAMTHKTFRRTWMKTTLMRTAMSFPVKRRLTIQLALLVPSKLLRQHTRKLWRYNVTCSQLEAMVGQRNCVLLLVQMASKQLLDLAAPDQFCPLRNCVLKMRRAFESLGERNVGEMLLWLGHLTPRVLPGKNPSSAAIRLQLLQNLHIILHQPKKERQPPLQRSSKMRMPPHQRRRRRLSRRRLRKRKKRKILETKRLPPPTLMTLLAMSMRMKSFWKKKRLVRRVLRKKQGKRHVN
mmetsp:Transcript_3069/g.4735  ORF Transcript_3069/g.4735 Transcript_3069/m.4735 type:complete len:251 (+) Transcript_3069:337-1089(+)